MYTQIRHSRVPAGILSLWELNQSNASELLLLNLPTAAAVQSIWCYTFGYRKLRLIIPGVAQLRKEFSVDFLMGTGTCFKRADQ